MSKVTKVGLVDMGSNAIRTEIIEFDKRESRTLEKHRAPVRLGGEVFATGKIKKSTIERAVDVFRAFREDCDQHSVDWVQAIATSATREASNGATLVDRIRKETGIDIEIISGETEAHLLRCAVETRIDLGEVDVLLVDLGGGSVEVVRVEAGKTTHAASFPIGSVRVSRAIGVTDEGPIGEALLDAIDAEIEPVLEQIEAQFGGGVEHYIAAGGNIESIADLISIDQELEEELGVGAVRIRDIERLARRLAKRPIPERRERFGLRPDRADTIVPAAVIYARIGRVADVKRVVVPRVGLRKGLRASVVGSRKKR